MEHSYRPEEKKTLLLMPAGKDKGLDRDDVNSQGLSIRGLGLLK